MFALADSSKRWQIVLRCTICGPLGLLFLPLVYTTVGLIFSSCPLFLVVPRWISNYIRASVGKILIPFDSSHNLIPCYKFEDITADIKLQWQVIIDQSVYQKKNKKKKKKKCFSDLPTLIFLPRRQETGLYFVLALSHELLELIHDLKFKLTLFAIMAFTVKSLYFVGAQFSWFSWIASSTNLYPQWIIVHKARKWKNLYWQYKHAYFTGKNDI